MNGKVKRTVRNWSPKKTTPRDLIVAGEPGRVVAGGWGGGGNRGGVGGGLGAQGGSPALTVHQPPAPRDCLPPTSPFACPAPASTRSFLLLLRIRSLA